MPPTTFSKVLSPILSVRITNRCEGIVEPSAKWYVCLSRKSGNGRWRARGGSLVASHVASDSCPLQSDCFSRLVCRPYEDHRSGRKADQVAQAAWRIIFVRLF